MLPPLVAVDLGRIDYDVALALQRRLVEERRRGEGHDALLLCEHEELVTTGRRLQTGRLTGERDADELAPARAAGLRVVEVERGGSATWHGPGQLVVYPIVRLAEGERDLHRVLSALEDAVAFAVRETTGLPAGPPAPPEGDGRRQTGVWVEGRKVASIGIACRGWVTYHGAALNLEADLRRFALFRPCDLEPSVMTSLSDLGAPVDRPRLIAALHARLAERLGRAPVAGRLHEGRLEARS